MAGTHTWTRRDFLGTALAGAVLSGWTRPGHANADPLLFGAARGLAEAPALEAAGFDYLEPGVGATLIPDKPDSEWPAQLAVIRALPLPVLVCNVFIPAALKLVGDQANHDGAAAYADVALRRAGAAGVKYIVLGSGGARRVPDGFDLQRAREQFVAFGKRIAPIAQAAGVTIALEPLNKKECNFLNYVRDGAAIVRAVGHPGFRLHADIYHMLQVDEPPQAIVDAGALIVHTHVAQKDTRLAPLPGGTDFRAYFAALKQIGYTGAMSIEGNWPEGPDTYTRTLAHLKEQWASA